MTSAALPDDADRRALLAPASDVASARLEQMFGAHFDFVWRSLRRLGLSEDRADDAAQQVFIVASRKIDRIERGAERSFLFGTAMRIASDIRRSAVVRREIAHPDPGHHLESGLRPDDLVEQRRARALLDDVLDTMELDLRTVFVLFELEEMTLAEIAALLDIPHGTAASRLRRAREDFAIRISRRERSPAGGGK